MKRIWKIVLVGLLISINGLWPELIKPQEGGFVYNTYGTVESISPKKIVLKETDYENEDDIRTTYNIDKNTKFNNISFKDIKIGKKVDITYRFKNGKNIVVSVSLTDETDTLLDEIEDDYSDKLEKIKEIK